MFTSVSVSELVFASVLESESEDDPHATPNIAMKAKIKSQRMSSSLRVLVIRVHLRPEMVAHR